MLIKVEFRGEYKGVKMIEYPRLNQKKYVSLDATTMREDPFFLPPSTPT